MCGVIGIIIFLVLLIKEVSEPTLPADYHRNWRLEQQDSDKVRYGEMTLKEFQKNQRNGKYR